MSLTLLTAGDARLEINAAIGGAVQRFLVRNQDVLRPAPEDASTPLQMACFPLAPFCNRIRDGVFAFAGETVRLAPNFSDHPHTLHGWAWQRPWTVALVSSDRAVLTLEQAAGEWPWSWRAEQHFAVRPDGLRIELKLYNIDRRPMPAGVGLHPYFPATASTRLKADTEGVWQVDEAPLPVSLSHEPWPRDWRAGAPIAGLDLVDHCYVGWNGRAELEEPGGARTVVTASPNSRWMHLYAPPRTGFVCVEPVTHMPDPFAHPDNGLSVLTPGENLAVWMDLARIFPRRA